MQPTLLEEISIILKEHPIVLFMKGTPERPQCGFSAQVSSLVTSLNVVFFSVNVLERSDIRAALPAYSDWPTFPQLFVNQVLIGGCDIVVSLHQSKKLLNILTL
jgi:monothiol glutaredoxin